MNSFDRIEDIGFQLASAKAELLRSRGWCWSSDTPDSMWMWKKEHKGRVYLAPEDLALHMESHGIWD